MKRPLLKKTTGFPDRLSLNEGQKVLQLEHSTILLIFIKLPIVTKTFVKSILSGRFTLVLLVLFCLLGVILFCLLAMALFWLVVDALVMPSNSCKARGSVYTYANIYSAVIFIEPLTHITVICIRHSIC